MNHKHVIVIGMSLFITALTISHFASNSPSNYDRRVTIEGMPSLINVPKETLLKDAQLIIQGEVIDQRDVKGKLGPATGNLIRVQEVLRGNYDKDTIEVVDIDNLKKGQNAILFLYRSQMFDGEWSIIGLQQGTYDLKQDRIKGKFLPDEGIDVKAFKEKFLGQSRR